MSERAVTFSTLGLDGRLGNQLWQIAAVIGRSLDLDMPIRLPPWVYADAFELPREWFELPDENDVQVGDLADYLTPVDRYVLQDIRLWWPYQDKVRMYLTPSRQVLDEVDALYGDVLRSGDVTGIHVRRGDYLDYPDKYPLPTVNYYREAVERLPAKELIVFTDDPQWVREHLPFLDRARMTCRPFGFLDLACMSRCDRLVIANSSFSWWGAFLSGSTEVIHPRHWYTPDHRDVVSQQITPAHWTPAD